MKYIVELIIEDNPVLSIKEATEIIKFLPIKSKNKDKKDKEKGSDKSESSLSIKQIGQVSNVNNMSIQLQKTFNNNSLSKSLNLKKEDSHESSKGLNQIYQNMEGNELTNTPIIPEEFIQNSTPLVAGYGNPGSNSIIPNIMNNNKNNDNPLSVIANHSQQNYYKDQNQNDKYNSSTNPSSNINNINQNANSGTTNSGSNNPSNNTGNASALGN